jgi:hypothetical protein
MRQALVIAQVALTLTLVTGALLFTSVLADLRSAPLGLATAGVLSVQLGDMPSASRTASRTPQAASGAGAGASSAGLANVPATASAASLSRIVKDGLGASDAGSPSAALDQATIGRALLERLTRVPGVRAAALASFTPLFGRPSMEPTARPPSTSVPSVASGQSDTSAPSGASGASGPSGVSSPSRVSNSSGASAGRRPSAAAASSSPTLSPVSAGPVLAEQATVTEAFFSVMGIPLVVGEGFRHTVTSDADGPRVAIVSESLARKLFGRPDPIGERIQVGRERQARLLDIVGVARDAVLTRPQAGNTLVVYQSFDQARPLTPTLIVQTTGADARPMAEAIGRELQQHGRWFPVRTRTLSEDRDAALSQERLLAWVSSTFGLLGLTLAVVGLYGLLALSVARRTSQIGVRMALGADRSRVVGMIAREALVLIAVGIALGLPIAWIAARAARTLIPGIASMPIAAITFAMIVLVAAGALAAWIPARRAASITPLLALRRD